MPPSLPSPLTYLPCSKAENTAPRDTSSFFLFSNPSKANKLPPTGKLSMKILLREAHLAIKAPTKYPLLDNRHRYPRIPLTAAKEHYLSRQIHLKCRAMCLGMLLQFACTYSPHFHTPAHCLGNRRNDGEPKAR